MEKIKPRKLRFRGLFRIYLKGSSGFARNIKTGLPDQRKET